MRVLCYVMVLAGAVAAQARPPIPLPVEIPFEYRGGQIWLQVTRPDAAQPLNFVLDSGAASSVLDCQAAQRLGVKLSEPVEVRGVGTQTVGAWTCCPDLHAGNVPLPSKLLVVDLRELSRASGRSIDGLIGADFFHHRIVQIDFAAQVLRLLPAAPSNPGASVLPLQVRRGAMRVPIRVNGSKPQWVRLDTGCASPLQWVAPHATPSDFPCQISVGLGEIAVAMVSASVQIGRQFFPAIPTGWHEQEIFPGEAGLLGNGLLARFRVTVDAPAGRLILEPLLPQTKP